MAAAVKALNAKIRANPVLDYFCSTHFWGPASNFGIPIAAIMDAQKDPEIISGSMTVALTGYSAVFMRYAMAVTPKNYLLFGCHAINFTSQLTQGYRYVSYWHMGGRDTALSKASQEASVVGDKAKGLVNQAGAGLQSAERKAEGLVDQAKDGLARAETQVKKGVEKVTGK